MIKLMSILDKVENCGIYKPSLALEWYIENIDKTYEEILEQVKQSRIKRKKRLKSLGIK